MKKINQLTDKEILALTQNDIEKLIKAECAEQGVKFEGEPKEPTYEVVPEPTITHFEVNDSYLRFTDKKEADKVSELLSACKSIVDYSFSSKHSVRFERTKKDREFSISVSKLYTQEESERINVILDQNDEIRKEYKALKDEWLEEREKYDAIATEIRGKVNEVHKKYNEMADNLRRMKNEYLPLADNNIDIAMNFLKKAYSIDEETEKYITDNINK